MGDRRRLTVQGAPTLASEACDRPPDHSAPRPARVPRPAHPTARTVPAPATGTPAPAPQWAGERYEVGPVLGRGGAGEVYRGYDRALRRHVAIKALHGETGPEHAARFEREVRLLARLQHPHLIPLYDAALGDGRHYLVMPLIRGATLAERITAGPLPHREAERIGTALAGALAYIHARGIAHRDVKPSNILLGHNGQIFLADFGIARTDERDQTMTTPGQLTGTAGYLAPEQVEGGETGPACDVYALGLVLLEALTGQRAFPGTQLEQALARLWRQPAIPLSLGPGWVRLLDAMTARDPARRPDCASVALLLHRLADPGPVATTTPVPPVTPATTQPAAGPPERRRRPVPRAAAAALTACLLTAGAATAARHAATPATAPPPGAMRVLAPGPVRALLAAPPTTKPTPLP